MASFLRFCFASALILAVSTPPPAAAEEFKVGGADGWRPVGPDEAEMYARWAASLRFHVGDSLRFQYKNDSVLVVDKWGFYHCNSTHPISVFDDGNTVINLERPGPVYFVSADLERCKNGQRLTVEVISLHPISPALSPSSSSESKFLVSPDMVLFYVVFATASIRI